MKGVKRSRPPQCKLGWPLYDCSRLDVVAGRLSVGVEHLDGIERVFVEILPDQRQLLQDVVGGSDDVAPDRVSLENIE